MAQVICPDCGTANNAGVEFCVSCGGFLAWEGDAPANEPLPPVVPQAAQQAQQAVPGAPPAGYPPAGGPSPTQAPGQEPQYRYRSVAPPGPPAGAPVAPPGPPGSQPPGGFEQPPRFVQQAGDPGGFSYTIRAPAGRAIPQGGPGWPPGPGLLSDEEGQVPLRSRPAHARNAAG